MPAFKRSSAYVKLLQELDLIQQTAVEDDAISLNSLESLEDRREEALKMTSNASFLSVDASEKNIKHVRSLSDVSDLHTEPLSEPLDNEYKNGNLLRSEPPQVAVVVKKEELKTGDFTLSVRFIETGWYYLQPVPT